MPVTFVDSLPPPARSGTPASFAEVQKDFDSSKDSRDAETRRVFQEEIDAEPDPKNKDILKKELASMDVGSGEKTPSGITYVDSFPEEKQQPEPSKYSASRAGKSLLTIADMIASAPGGLLEEGIYRANRMAGTDANKAREIGQQVTGTLKLTNPIHRITDYFGITNESNQSYIDSAMSKVGKWVKQGEGVIERETNGKIKAEDVQSLVNGVQNAAGVGGMRLIAGIGKGMIGKVKAANTAGKLASEDSKTAQVREEPHLNEPDPVKPEENPSSAAKRQIEASLNIEDPVVRKTRLARARQQAKAAFGNDTAYNEYIKGEANGETLTRESAKETEATKIEQQEKTQAREVQPPLWSEVIDIVKKPGFQRSAEEIAKLRRYARSGGKADPLTLAKMAAVGLGGVVGANMDSDDPIVGALIGTIGVSTGLTALKGPKALYNGIQKALKPDQRLNIFSQLDEHEGNTKVQALNTMRMQTDIHTLVPDKARRASVVHWIQGDKTIPLTNNEYAAAKIARDWFDAMGKAGMNAKVLDKLIPDYVTNLWDLGAKNKAIWDQMAGGVNIPTSTRFAMQRKIQSLRQGKAMGLTPKTEDLIEIMGIYSKSLSRAIENKKLMDSLKTTMDPQTQKPLLVTGNKAPSNYVPLQTLKVPNLKADANMFLEQKVHPDIAKSLEFYFGKADPRGTMAALDMVATVAKRMAVSFSLFHANALYQAALGAKAGGFTTKIPGILSGKDSMLQQLKHMGLGTEAEEATRSGLEFSYDKSHLAVEDVGNSFYDTMGFMQRSLDENLPIAGKAAQAVIDVNHAVDRFMWDRLHTGLKLNVWGMERQRLMRNNLDRAAADPTYKVKTQAEVDKIASNYTNSLFGGLNWRQVAESYKHEWSRDLAMKVLGAEGRRAMRILMFAPDWTISTTRAFTQAFGKGSGLKGLLKPTELADLHRRYIIRSAAYYFTVGNAINIAMSGHPVWENKDPTYLENGDGDRIQIAKHATEPIHYIKPFIEAATNKMGLTDTGGPGIKAALGRIAVNKTGVVPKEIVEQIAGVEYLNPGGHQPPMKHPLMHALKSMAPISAQAGESGAEGVVMSMMGMPIYPTKGSRRYEDIQEKRKEKREEEAEDESSSD